MYKSGNKMSINAETADRIKRAVMLGKLDSLLSEDYLNILLGQKQTKLDEIVVYEAIGTPSVIPPEMKHNAGNIYTATTTYSRLIEYVENDEFTSFEKSHKLRYLNQLNQGS